MKTQFVFIICVFGLMAFAQQPDRRGSVPTRMDRQLLRRISESVVTISVNSLDGIGYGSGFVISPSGLCVTNYHVLRDAFSAEVKMKNGDKFEIRHIIGYDTKVDLVIFQLNIPRNKTVLPLKIESRFPRPGDNVTNISNPLGILEQSIANGNVAQVRKHKDRGYVIQHTAPTSGGSSGAPLFNMKGEVIGIEVSGMGNAKAQNINFAIASLKLTELLQKSEGKRPIGLLDMTDDPLFTRNIKLALVIYKSNLSQAIDLLKKETKNNPNNYLAYEYWGSIYYNRGYYGDGINAYLQASKIKRRAENLAGYAINYSAAARASYDKSYFDEAYRWLNESVKIKADPSVYYEMACLLYDYTVKYKHLNRNQLEKALNAVNLSLQYYNKPAQFGFYIDWAYIIRGQINEARGKPEDALNDYENAIGFDKNEYRGYHARSKLRALHFNDITGGLQDAAKALSLCRDKYKQGEILHTQALIYKKFNDLNSALKKLQEAYDITKKDFYLQEKDEWENGYYSNGEDYNGESFSDNEDDFL